jgi:hypothetical protein
MSENNRGAARMKTKAKSKLFTFFSIPYTVNVVGKNYAARMSHCQDFP